MITDADLADLCVAAYAGETAAQWKFFEPGLKPPFICYGITRIGDVDVVAFRGSVTFLDWRRDLDTWADPHDHGALGPLHPGFAEGMAETWQTIQHYIGAQAIFTGHSLGAARATILTGLAVRDGFKPQARVVFGEPAPGFETLANLIGGIPGRSYRNGDAHRHDLICDIPYYIPPLWSYVHPTPLTKVSFPPDIGLVAKLGVFCFHHMPLYQRAMIYKPQGPSYVPPLASVPPGAGT